MRRTTLAVLAAATLALAGCSSSSSDSKPAAKPSPAETVSPGDSFLGIARQIPFNGTPADETLLEYPPKWCTALDDGHSVEWMFSMTDGGLYPIGDDWGTAEGDADTLLVAGVKAYCPRNLADVEAQLRADGKY